LFRSINVNFRQEINKGLRCNGTELTFGEISPMSELLLRPGCNGAQLARQSMVSAQAMNIVLQRLASKGYIERRPHPDSLRADSWHLTDEGMKLLKQARGVFDDTISRMLSGLNDKDVGNLERYLRSCAESLGAADDE